MLAENPSLSSLRWRWCLVAVAYACCLALGYAVVRSSWPSTYAQNWVLWSLLVLTIHLAILWWGLKHNHRRDERHLLPTLGYGNGLTLTRGLIIALLAGFLFAPRPVGLLAWAPALLYTIACVLDYLDGFVARVTDHATVLGEILDIEYDGMGMLVAVTLAIQYGQVPPWYFVLGLGRQLFIFGIWMRRRLGLPVHELPPSDNRRLIAGFQMGFMAVMLWPILAPPITTVAVFMFSVPLATSFGRDWLVVSGWIDAAAPGYRRSRRALKLWLEKRMPLLLRLLGAGLFLAIMAQVYPTFAAWRLYLTQAVTPPVGVLLGVVALLSPLAALCYLLGIWGRVSALLLGGVALLDMLATGFAWPANGLLLICGLWVLQSGSGAFSLWSPEEQILRRRVGQRKAGAR
jgi:CDP-diacylglycerol--glycerol-3-phosphate 3-phosphatidyltransferase